MFYCRYEGEHSQEHLVGVQTEPDHKRRKKWRDRERTSTPRKAPRTKRPGEQRVKSEPVGRQETKRERRTERTKRASGPNG